MKIRSLMNAWGLATLSLPAFAAEPASPPKFIVTTPAEVHWKDVPGGHGAQVATLVGDPDKNGFYVIRVKFPPHWMDSPHWHPNARYVTVLEGTWYVGTGTVIDPAKAVPLPPGSLMVHPARAPHWDGAPGEKWGPSTSLYSCSGSTLRPQSLDRRGDRTPSPTPAP